MSHGHVCAECGDARQCDVAIIGTLRRWIKLFGIVPIFCRTVYMFCKDQEAWICPDCWARIKLETMRSLGEIHEKNSRGIFGWLR